MLQVGFDASPLVRPHPRGIQRVVAETLEALEARGKIEVVRIVPTDDVQLSRWRQTILPQEARGLAGVHSFLSAFAWRASGKQVQTIHELPWRHGVRENADWRHRLWARLGPLRADAVVTATAVVARELGRPLATEGGKVHVIPWGVGAPFANEPPAGTVDEVVLGRYRLPDAPFALCPGAVRAKKNLAGVLRGLARLRTRDGRGLHLVVTGPDTPQLRRDLGLVRSLGLTGHVSTPGEIDAEDLPRLLRLASVVPVLSHSEGFGLPVLEALASGTPVVVPRGSAQSEVAGEQGFAVDAGDADSVADGLAAALERREELRWTLPERAAEFSWDRTAAAIEALWEGLA